MSPLVGMHDNSKAPPTRDRLQLQKTTLRTLLDDELDHVGGGTWGSAYTGTEGGWNCWSPAVFGGGGGGSGGGMTTGNH
jgi:hypothetical protein